MKKLISILLTVSVLFCLYPQNMTVRADEAGTDMESMIREQIEAFAKSIDQKDASNKASKALASHGISGRGKKLSVGKNHALTATLWNSELMKGQLIHGCTQLIQIMQKMDEDVMYLDGGCNWYSSKFYFDYTIYPNENQNISEQIYSPEWQIFSEAQCNSYDLSLVWMAGGANSDLVIRRGKVTADTVTYDISLKIYDRFDFSTGNGSGFKDLISGIGALLFREFDWESDVSFQLTVPYTCSHKANNYHWTLDTETKILQADTSEGYTENMATKHTVDGAPETRCNYYELAETVTLAHDRPWVMELTLKNPPTFSLSAFNFKTEYYPHFLNYKRKFLYVRRYERVRLTEEEREEMGVEPTQAFTHGYGTALGEYFYYSPWQTYTLSIENKIEKDGSNMLYLTVYNNDTEEKVLDHVPLNDHFRSYSKVEDHALKSTENNAVSGMDFKIKYIGNESYRLGADEIDLKIWENGKERDGDFLTQKVTKPTCASKGYTTYTCSLCGYSYKDNYTAQTDHVYTNETDGDCNTCGYLRTVRGDMNDDGTLNSADAVYLLRHSIMAEQYPITQSADVNGDGTVNGADAIYLLRHCIMPKEYPLA